MHEQKPSKIIVFDEARFGTHTKTGYGWFKKGGRTQVPVKLGYKNFYLYGGVDIKDGSNFNLFLPKCNTENMNVFLSELSKEYPEDRISMIMDGAGWHKSKGHIVPANIKIIYLPPYSPELNPVERLWLYIKKNVLSNRIYEELEDLEISLCGFIMSLDNAVVKNICSANYLAI